MVASKYGLLHFAIMIVACMSVQELYDDDSIVREHVGTVVESSEAEKSSDDEDLVTTIDRERMAAKQKLKKKDDKERKYQATSSIKRIRA